MKYNETMMQKINRNQVKEAQASEVREMAMKQERDENRKEFIGSGLVALGFFVWAYVMYTGLWSIWG